MSHHICASCGDIIPYGRDICWRCEHGYTPDKRIQTKEVNDDDSRIFERTENEVSTEG